MTTEIAQTEEKPAAAPEAAPVVAHAASHALVEERAAPAVVVGAEPVRAPAEPAKPPVPYVPVTGLAAWLSKHRSFTKEPFSYLAYQFVRATFATIPYGFGMAAGHHAFQAMSAKGQKLGLTAKGIEEFAKRGPLAMSSVADAERAAL